MASKHLHCEIEVLTHEHQNSLECDWGIIPNYWNSLVVGLVTYSSLANQMWNCLWVTESSTPMAKEAKEQTIIEQNVGYSAMEAVKNVNITVCLCYIC